MNRPPYHWTPDEIDRLETLRTEGWTSNELRYALGRTPTAIKAKLKYIHAPRTNFDRPIRVMLTASDVAKLDTFARSCGLTPAEAVRILIRTKT